MRKISLVFVLLNNKCMTSIQGLLVRIIWLVDLWNVEGTVAVQKQCVLVSVQLSGQEDSFTNGKCTFRSQKHYLKPPNQCSTQAWDKRGQTTAMQFFHQCVMNLSILCACPLHCMACRCWWMCEACINVQYES